ncbi:MAG: carboxypeptidase-like regulatory domain-containing protein [Terriglobales bacterium]
MIRRIPITLMLILLAAPLTLAQLNGAGSKSLEVQRELSGQVMTKTDAPLPESIVYLKNMKTLAIRTFIADDNGNYRFPGLSPNVDYEVHAEYKGKKSDTKTLSSFDTRNKVYFPLRIDVRK